MSAGEQELRTFEVSVKTHTSSVRVEAVDEEQALADAQELLEQLHELDRHRDNLTVEAKP